MVRKWLARAFLPLLLVSGQACAEEGFRWVADPVFQDAGSAHRGVVPLMQGGRWGLMGANGEWVAEPQFEAIGAAAEGLFPVKSGGFWGLMDWRGNLLYAYDFDEIGRPGPMTPVKWQGKWLVLHLDGTSDPVPLAFDTLIGNDGDCFTGLSGGVPVVETRRGEPKAVPLPQVDKIFAPSEGFVVSITAEERRVLFCGYPENAGFDAPFAEARRVAEGFGGVRQGDLWGFVARGTYGFSDIEPQFQAVREFSEGLAPVQDAFGKWGYIDRWGRMVIPPQFDAAFGHSEGLAGVRIGELRGFIDRTGSLIVAPQFQDFWRHEGGVLPVKTEAGWGVIAPLATDPATRDDLPLGKLNDRPADSPKGFEVLASTPHFYSGQDTQSRQDLRLTSDGRVMLTMVSDAYISGEAGEIALWDTGSRRLIRKLPVAGLSQAMPIGKGHLILAGLETGEIVILDAVTGEALHRLRPHGGPVTDMRLSPDGTRFASLGGGILMVWSAKDGDLLLRHLTRAQKFAFAEDGQSIWLGHRNGQTEKIDPAGATLIGPTAPIWPQETDVQAFAGFVFPDMSISSTGIMAVLDRSANDCFGNSESYCTAIHIVGPGVPRRIDLPENISTVESVDISADGRLIAFGGSDFALSQTLVQIWDSASAKLVQSFEASSVLAEVENPGEEQAEASIYSFIDRVRFTGPATLVALSGEGGAIVEYDLSTGQETARYGERLSLAVGSVTLTDLSRVFTTDGAGMLTVWDMEMGRLEARFDTGIASALDTYIGTDGQRVMVIDGFDDTVNAAVKADTLEVLPPNSPETLSARDRAVADSWERRPAYGEAADLLLARLPTEDFRPPLLFSDGRLAMTYRSVGEHRVFDLQSGELLATFLAAPDGEWLVLTPEGFFAASERGGRLVSVAQGLSSFAVDQVYQALFRPDLVREKLAGDPEGRVAEAAARLNLADVIGSGPAPRTRFALPLPDGSAPDPEVEIAVELLDEGGGIGRVEWRVNGLTVDVQPARGAAALDAEGTLARARLALEPGDNLVEVVAYNAAGLLASAPQSLTIRWDGVASTTPPDLYVLAVGVNDYADGRLKLNYAAADARAFAAAMEKAGQGLFGKTKVITLLDAQVTDASLDATFADLGQMVRPQDVFVFFLAGHGKTVDGVYHFIPQDFRFDGEDAIRSNGIAQDRWQEWSARVKARKSVMIYDTCESGSLTGTRSVDAAMAQSAAVQRLTRAMGRTILSAATDDAPALEGYRGHGVMTFALLEAMGKGDANGNATIEVTELAGWLDLKVPEISSAAFGFRQVPQMSIRGSDFALAAAVPVLDTAAEEIFPATLTHVVAPGTPVLDGPGGTPLQEIPPGAFFGVFLVEEREGHARIAKDGKALGWVSAGALTPLQ